MNTYVCSGHNMNMTTITNTIIMKSIYICSGHNMNINTITNTRIMKCIHMYVLVIT